MACTFVIGPVNQQYRVIGDLARFCQIVNWTPDAPPHYIKLLLPDTVVWDQSSIYAFWNRLYHERDIANHDFDLEIVIPPPAPPAAAVVPAPVATVVIPPPAAVILPPAAPVKYKLYSSSCAFLCFYRLFFVCNRS
jgi:hypothetical protein